MKHPFLLVDRGAGYWRCDDPPALIAALQARHDCHEWRTAARDQKSGKEYTRFYHKPPGVRRTVEPAGIVIEYDGTVRLVGTDPERARRVLVELAAGLVEQGTLFDLAGGVR